ncbi:hypothetical protein HDU92_006736 [Lobulomyces angularis]|nr:hypothetical protein HDU92_006736 [Lobulomyces angularis]
MQRAAGISLGFEPVSTKELIYNHEESSNPKNKFPGCYKNNYVNVKSKKVENTSGDFKKTIVDAASLITPEDIERKEYKNYRYSHSQIIGKTILEIGDIPRNLTYGQKTIKKSGIKEIFNQSILLEEEENLKEKELNYNKNKLYTVVKEQQTFIDLNGKPVRDSLTWTTSQNTKIVENHYEKFKNRKTQVLEKGIESEEDYMEKLKESSKEELKMKNRIDNDIFNITLINDTTKFNNKKKIDEDDVDDFTFLSVTKDEFTNPPPTREKKKIYFSSFGLGDTRNVRNFNREEEQLHVGNVMDQSPNNVYGADYSRFKKEFIEKKKFGWC